MILRFQNKTKAMVHIGDMIRGGASLMQVSSEVGLSRRHIRRLKRDPRIYNAELCKQSRLLGRRPRLSTKQQADVRLALLAKFSLSEHSIARARRIIREVSGVDYAPAYVYELLRKLKAKLPKGVLFGHYNHTKHRCNTCGQLLVKRECLLCMIREIKAQS